jgi:hypothetical protein
MKDSLTGRTYHKQTWFGLILMVEYEEADSSPGFFIKKWRKAKATDLIYLKELKYNKYGK